MAASKAQIGQWFDEAKRNSATHMLVVCDGFDFDDYPVHVFHGQDPERKAEEYNAKGMQRVMEIYDLSISKEVQLDQTRVWNTGPAPTRNA